MNRTVTWTICVLIAWSWGACSSVARGVQDEEKSAHKVDPIDPAFAVPLESDYNLSDKEQKREYTTKKTEVNRARKAIADSAESVLAGTVDLNAGRGDLTKYLTGIVFPEMTETDGDSLFQLAERREALMKMLRDAPAGSPVRDVLLSEMIVPTMTRISGDEGYHPAVRLNAVLILGELNEQEGIRGGAAPKPLPAATQYLVQVAGDEKNPNFLRIGALAGLIRHANLDGQLFRLNSGGSAMLDDANRTALINLACAQVDKVAGTDFSTIDDETYWLTRQAVQALGELGRPGEGGKVAVCLRQLLENAQTPTLLMCDAITAYGSLQFTDAAQAEAGPTAALIGRFLSAALLAEARSIDEYMYSVKEKRMLDSKTSEATGVASSSAGAGGDDGSFTSGGSGAPSGGKGKAAAKAASKAEAAGDGSIVFPVYMVNEIRQRSKASTYVCRVALDGNPPRRRNEATPASNLKKFADEPTQQAIAKLVAVLDRIMDETSLAPKKAGPGETTVRAPAPTGSLDARLKSVLETASADIDRVVETLAPKTGS